MDWADLAAPLSRDTLAIAGKILAAGLAGLLLGLDREIRGHAAGLRTHALVAIAAAATAALSLELYHDLLAANPDTNADPLRIVEGLVAAVGFLGGGLIIRAGGQVHGLTTAANLWACGVVGLAFGAGLFRVAVITLVLAIAVLVGLKAIETRLLPGQREEPD